MGWRLGLDAIIINDGNYGDFTRGQRIEVALECDLWEPATPTECEPSATFSGQSRWSAVDYAICAEVIHRYDRTGEVVLDCGSLRVLTTSRGGSMIPKDVARIASTEAALSVDSFTYFERLAHIPAFPPLIYTWIVDDILLDTTPRAKLGWGQRRSGQRVFTSIEETDARSDDGGRAEYVLKCTLLDVPPKRDSATAIP